MVAAAACGGDGAPPERAERARSVAPPAATTTTTTVRQATAAEPLRVAVVGDSLMFDAVPAVEAALRAGGPVEVRSVAALGFGLSHGPFDWRVEWPKLLAETRAEAVVVMLGAWDLGPADADGGPPVPAGTPEWQEWYAGLLDEAAGVLGAGGARVYWMSVPPLEPAPLAAGVPGLNEAVRALAGRRPGVVFVDAGATLAGPGGAFTPTLPGPDGGEPVLARKPDGVHFCPDGAARLAEAVAEPLLAGWGLRLAPGWEQGSWRADQRYHWASGGGCAPATS